MVHQLRSRSTQKGSPPLRQSRTKTSRVPIERPGAPGRFTRSAACERQRSAAVVGHAHPRRLLRVLVLRESSASVTAARLRHNPLASKAPRPLIQFGLPHHVGCGLEYVSCIRIVCEDRRVVRTRWMVLIEESPLGSAPWPCMVFTDIRSD